LSGKLSFSGLEHFISPPLIIEEQPHDRSTG
jgi:hypothetical protein